MNCISKVTDDGWFTESCLFTFSPCISSFFLFPYHTKYQVNCLLGWQRTFTSTVFHWSSTTFYFVYWFLDAVHYSDTSAVFFFFFFTETDNLPSFWWWCFDKFGGGRLYCCSRSKEWIKSNSDLMSRFVYNMFYQSLCLMYHQEHRAQVTWSWMTALGNAYFHGPPKIQKQHWTYVHIFIYYI